MRPDLCVRSTGWRACSVSALSRHADADRASHFPQALSLPPSRGRYPMQTPQEKARFFKSLPALLPRIPQSMALYRVLPALMTALEFGAAGASQQGAAWGGVLWCGCTRRRPSGRAVRGYAWLCEARAMLRPRVC